MKTDQIYFKYNIIYLTENVAIVISDFFHSNFVEKITEKDSELLNSAKINCWFEVSKNHSIFLINLYFKPNSPVVFIAKIYNKNITCLIYGVTTPISSCDTG